MQRISGSTSRNLAVTLISTVALAAGSLGLSFGCASLSPAPALTARPPDAPGIELAAPADAPAATLRVMRIAHASVLLDFDGYRVLTDPWFSEKAHYHHGEPLGMALEDLPSSAP